MSQEHDETMTGGGEAEPLPRELEGIQREIAADGVAWARDVPRAEEFNARLRAALEGADTRVASRPLRTVELATTSAELPAVSVRHVAQGPGRLGRIGGLVAAVVVVGLLASVFALLASHGGTSVGNPGDDGPGLRVAATYTGQPGLPVVAPSDPRVVYEYADNRQGPVLRRSDDGGATWSDLAIPGANTTGASVSALHLGVNPADASNVFLRADLGFARGDPNGCPADATQKGAICPREYYSTDRGAHWNVPRLPVPGTLFDGGVFFFYPSWILQAQGSRLYAGMLNSPTALATAADIRIASTEDGGKTWRLADAGLAAQGLHVCDYLAAPHGETLFARTADVCSSSDPNTLPTARRLWRSDDAGAHWTEVTVTRGPVARADVALVAASTSDTAGQVTLFASVPDASGVKTFYASTDSGQSWAPAPAKAGLPGEAHALQTSLATLADGSLVVAFATEKVSAAGAVTVACYAWRPGLQGWARVTRPVKLGQGTPNVFVTDGGQRVVTLSSPDDLSSSPTFNIVRFG